MPRYVGLGHTSRVGKDSLANAILRSLAEMVPQIPARRQSFASKLKAVTHDLYGWAGLKDEAFYNEKQHEHLRQEKLPALGLTPVEVWCRFGTDAVRHKVYGRTWVDYVMKTPWPESLIVIPDVRFPNEAEAIKEAGGWLVKVVRPGYGPLPTAADQALLGYTGWDLVVGGSGEMAELLSWGEKIARCIAVGEHPRQSEHDRQSALSVEVLPPTGPQRPRHTEAQLDQLAETIRRS
jgi:hypothetical protein